MIGTHPKVQAWAQRRKTIGFTKQSVLNDILDAELSRRQLNGSAPTFTGITTPRPPVATSKEALDQLRGFSMEHKKDKRGQAFEHIDSNDRGYRQRRKEFLVESEGNRSWVYEDHKGIRTVGIGFNMDQPGAERMFTTALGVSKETFEKVRDGKEPMMADQVNKLFDFSVQEAEKVVATRLKDVPLNNHQRLALVSLAFNNPSLLGPDLVSQIQAGDTDAAIDEIMYRSNKTKHKGLAKRRYREAIMFAGPGNVDVDGTNPDASRKVPNLTEFLASL